MFAKIQEKNSQVRSKITGFLEQFKELGLSEQCKSIRSGLTTFVTNNEIFSSHITDQLVPSKTGVPYELYSDDPEQVMVLKKITNILYNVETILESLEKNKLTEDMYTIGLVKHAPELFKQSLKAMEQISEAVTLVNNSSASIQAIMGPQLKSLEPAYNYVMAQMYQFTPSGVLEGAEQQLGSAIGNAVNMLPSRRKTAEGTSFIDMSSAIANIPNYFIQLKSAIESESLVSYKKPSQSEEDYKYQLEMRGRSLAKVLGKASNNEGIQHLKILKEFGRLATDIVNTAIPATKEAYIKTIEKLNQFKHELLPNMISELESLEESLGLKSGTLTDPALEFADTYYTQLAETVNEAFLLSKDLDAGVETANKWYAKAGKKLILGKAIRLDSGNALEQDHDITTLLDSTVIKAREQNQNVRLDEAKTRQHEAEECNKAAEAFYAKIHDINTFRNDGQFSNVSVEDKQELAFLYKQFQPYMAVNSPELDAQIVNYLKLSPKEIEQLHKGKPEAPTYFQSLWGGLGSVAAVSLIAASKMAEGSSATLTAQENEFNTIFNTKEDVLSSISRAISTEQLRIDLINDTKTHAEKSTYEKSDKQTLLEESAVLPVLTEYKYVKGLSAEELYQKRLVIENEHSEIVRAEKSFNNFMEKLDALSKPDELVSNLNEPDKEALRAEYKKCQPYLYLLGKDNPAIRNLNVQLVTSLMNPSGTHGDSLTLSQVSSFKKEIEGNFEALKDKRNLIIQSFSLLEAKARKNPKTEISLEPIPITSKNALSDQASAFLSKLKESNISAKIDGFLKTTLLPALKDNLEEGLVNKLGLNGDLSSLKPYPENNEDISQVKLYKNLVNSFLHLEQAIKAYEQVGKEQGFMSIEALSLAKSVYTIGTAAKQAVNAIQEVQNNPILANLVQLGMDAISPLKENTLLQSYFEDIAPKIDQLKENASNEEVDPINVLMDGLNIIETLIPTQNPEELQEEQSALKSAIVNLNEAVSNLGIPPKNIANLLTAVKVLQSALNNKAVDAHEIIIENIKNIRAQFHESIIKPLDDAEYELGIKPGALTDKVSEHFDRFYLNLLDKAVNDTQQNDLMLLVVKPIGDRISNEINRLKELQKVVPQNKVEEAEKLHNIQYMEAKIEYLKVHLVNEPHKKVEQFKRLKFEEYVNNNISGLFDKSLGAYGKAFFKEMQPGLLALQDEILADISIEDDIGQKIVEALLPKVERLMSKITDPENHDVEIASLKGAYDQFLAAHTQVNKIGEMERVLENELKGSALFKSIQEEIRVFEQKAVQFSKDYEPGASIEKHNAECDQFKARLDLYKVFIKPENLAVYKNLGQERSALVNREDLSFLEKQKLDFIKTYEAHIMKYAENHSESEISGEIQAFQGQLKDYNKLIQIDKFNTHLVTMANKSYPATDSSPSKVQINQFSTEIRAILMDKNIGLPKDKLDQISVRAHQEDLSSLSKEPAGNPVINFFKGIVQKIIQVITGKTAPESPQETIQKFNSFKDQFKKIAPEPSLKSEEPEVTPSLSIQQRI